MRTAIPSILLLAVLGLTIWLTRHHGTRRPTLTIMPAGQPRFEAGSRRKMVLLTLGVTNNTGSSLSQRFRLSFEREPSAFAFSDVDLLTPFKVGPRSGTLCTVRYDSHSRRLILDAEYKKDRGLAEATIRRLLQGLRVPGGWTNDLWHSVRVGRIVQH